MVLKAFGNYIRHLQLSFIGATFYQRNNEKPMETGARAGCDLRATEIVFQERNVAAEFSKRVL